MEDAKLLEGIRVSATYGKIKYELIEQIWELRIENTRADKEGELNKYLVNRTIKLYDALWGQWKALKNRVLSVLPFIQIMLLEIMKKGVSENL